MEAIIEHLKSSIDDENLSGSERKVLKQLLRETPLSRQQLLFLRSKIYDMAHEHIHASNYRSVLQWLKDVTGSLPLPDVPTSNAWFSPGDACRNGILRELNEAQQEIKICVFTISDDLISTEIVRAHNRGVSVEVITDNDKLADEGSDIDYLAKHGIVIKTDDTPNHMHHKFMVADSRRLLTGSYNWTRSAARFNQENLLLTEDAMLVRAYLKEFEQLWKVMPQYGV